MGFIIGVVFFELMLFGNGGIFGNLALPIVLIAIGGFMLLGNKKGRFVGSDAGKRKMGDLHLNGKYKNSDRLQQQIDEALAEDDEHHPVV